MEPTPVAIVQVILIVLTLFAVVMCLWDLHTMRRELTELVREARVRRQERRGER